MRATQKLAATLTAIAALSLLFVVVCPITVTPTAVVSSHAAHGSGPTLPAAAVLTLSLLIAAAAPARRPAPRGHAHPLCAGHTRLFDLTCARLC